MNRSNRAVSILSSTDKLMVNTAIAAVWDFGQFQKACNLKFYSQIFFEIVSNNHCQKLFKGLIGSEGSNVNISCDLKKKKFEISKFVHSSKALPMGEKYIL